MGKAFKICVMALCLIFSACGNVSVQQGSEQNSGSIGGGDDGGGLTPVRESLLDTAYVNCNRKWINNGIINKISTGHGLVVNTSWVGKQAYLSTYLENTAEAIKRTTFHVYGEDKKLKTLSNPQFLDCNLIGSPAGMDENGVAAILLCKVGNINYTRVSFYDATTNTWSSPEEYGVSQIHFDSNRTPYGLFMIWDPVAKIYYSQIKKKTGSTWVDYGIKIYNKGNIDFFIDKKDQVYVFGRNSDGTTLFMANAFDGRSVELSAKYAINWNFVNVFNKETQILPMSASADGTTYHYEFDIAKWEIREIYKQPTNNKLVFKHIQLTNGEHLISDDRSQLKIGKTFDKMNVIFNSNVDKLEGYQGTIYALDANKRGDLSMVVSAFGSVDGYRYYHLSYECE
jgi:hypothetical protein